MKTKKRFKFGDKTKEVYCGDIVAECEFITYHHGALIFYDTTFKCFRRVFWLMDVDRNYYMNGWTCAATIGGLINE